MSNKFIPTGMLCLTFIILPPNEIADIEQAVREVYREKEITKDRDSIYEKEGGKYEGE